MTESPEQPNEPPATEPTANPGHPEETPAPRPDLLTKAEALVILSALLWLPASTFSYLELLLLALYVTFAIRAYAGRPTARNAMLGMAILLSLWMPVVLTEASVWVVVPGVLALVACWVAMVLFYRPDSNAFFRTSEHAPNAQPATITAAGFLLVVSFLFWSPLANKFFPELMSLLLLVLVVSALLAIGGRRKARTVAAVAAALVMVPLTPFSWLGFADTGDVEIVVTVLLALVITCAGLKLLYLRGNDAYFERAEERRRIRKGLR